MLCTVYEANEDDNNKNLSGYYADYNQLGIYELILYEDDIV